MRILGSLSASKLNHTNNKLPLWNQIFSSEYNKQDDICIWNQFREHILKKYCAIGPDCDMIFLASKHYSLTIKYQDQ